VVGFPRLQARAEVNTFTIAEGCEGTITLASYEKPSPGFDRDVSQELDTLTVDLPSDDDDTATSAIDFEDQLSLALSGAGILGIGGFAFYRD